jgi:hypothetical protein
VALTPSEVALVDPAQADLDARNLDDELLLRYYKGRSASSSSAWRSRRRCAASWSSRTGAARWSTRSTTASRSGR